MTQTASFNPNPAPAQEKQPRGKLKGFFTVFKWELRNCKSPLIIFSILSGVAITVILTLAVIIGLGIATENLDAENPVFDYTIVQNSVLIFQYIASYVVFFLNAIFTVIYTIRIFSYLHNKRKADMYGALPVTRRAFYVAKTVSAFIFSVVPTMFFLSLIAVISVMFGQPVVNEVAKIYVQLLFGSMACISFYGLLAVCCGTSLNSVLTFVAVNFAYPLSALLIKGVLKSFMYGIPTDTYNNSFIMKALNPLSAYDGTNLIYWVLFIAACLFLGIFLVKKRKAECAQTSFAYYLPCYIVKLLIAFIAGMFLGVVFAGTPMFISSYLRFCFGFILGAIPAYIITHLILYKGFKKLMKTAIPLGVLMLVVIAAMGCLHFDPLGYTTRVPDASEIASAGVVDLGNCYQVGRQSNFSIASQAADDFTDKDDIERITSFHSAILKDAEEDASLKYINVWASIATSSVPTDLLNDGYCVSYKLNNGTTMYRMYEDRLFNYNSVDTTRVEKLFDSEAYFNNYSPVMNIKPDEINAMGIDSTHDDFRGMFSIDRSDSVSERTANADRQRILEAFRKDVAAHGYSDSYGSSIYTLRIRYDNNRMAEDGSLTYLLVASIAGSGTESYYIPEEYTETIAVLKDMHLINSDNSANHDSLYYNSGNWSYYYY